MHKKKLITALVAVFVVAAVIAGALIAVSTLNRNAARDMLIGRAFRGTYYGADDDFKTTYGVEIVSDTLCNVYRCELIKGKCYDEQHDYWNIPYRITGGLNGVQLDVMGQYGTETANPLTSEKSFDIVVTEDGKVELYVRNWASGYSLTLKPYAAASDNKTPTKLP